MHMQETVSYKQGNIVLMFLAKPRAAQAPPHCCVCSPSVSPLASILPYHASSMWWLHGYIETNACEMVAKDAILASENLLEAREF